MPCKPILCKTCQYQNTDEDHNCDLSDQWAIFGKDPNEPCESYRTTPTKDKLLTYTCPDLDCPYDSKDMRVCQYCFHIPEDQVAKLKPQDWVCDLPNREAQRRHHAGLTEKQKVL